MTMYSFYSEEELRKAVNGLLFCRVDTALLRDLLTELDSLRAVKLAAERVRDDCWEVIAPDGEIATADQQYEAWQGLVAALRFPVQAEVSGKVTIVVISSESPLRSTFVMTEVRQKMLDAMLGYMLPEERVIIEEVRSMKLIGSEWFEWYNTQIPGKLDKYGGPAANGDILEEITDRVVKEALYFGAADDDCEAMDTIGHYISESWCT